MLIFSLSIWEACLKILSRSFCDSDFTAKCLNEIWLFAINVGLNQTGNSEMQCVSHAKPSKSIISTTLCIYSGKKKCVSWISVFLLGTDALSYATWSISSEYGSRLSHCKALSIFTTLWQYFQSQRWVCAIKLKCLHLLCKYAQQKLDQPYSFHE